METADLLSAQPGVVTTDTLTLLVAPEIQETSPVADLATAPILADASFRPDVSPFPRFDSRLDVATIAGMLAGLGHIVRLEVLRTLLPYGSTGLAAGRIAATLRLSPSSLSFHLGHMVHGRLLIQRRRGRQIIYAANRSTLAALSTFLQRDMSPPYPVALTTDQATDVERD